jgi:hypothetical protein
LAGPRWRRQATGCLRPSDTVSDATGCLSGVVLARAKGATDGRVSFLDIGTPRYEHPARPDARRDERRHSPAGIQIAGYHVVVEREDPFRLFDVRLPATATSVTVPPEFLDSDTEYSFEVLAVEAGVGAPSVEPSLGGNQTISSSSFTTSFRLAIGGIPVLPLLCAGTRPTRPAGCADRTFAGIWRSRGDQL